MIASGLLKKLYSGILMHRKLEAETSVSPGCLAFGNQKNQADSVSLVRVEDFAASRVSEVEAGPPFTSLLSENACVFIYFLKMPKLFIFY